MIVDAAVAGILPPGFIAAQPVLNIPAAAPQIKDAHPISGTHGPHRGRLSLEERADPPEGCCPGPGTAAELLQNGRFSLSALPGQTKAEGGKFQFPGDQGLEIIRRGTLLGRRGRVLHSLPDPGGFLGIKIVHRDSFLS